MNDIYFSASFSQLQTLGAVAVAMLLGGLIGLEREYADKPAGFRTHMLVAGAAALLVGLADALGHRFSDEAYAQALRIDPIRVIEAVITGISFLGAGTIFRRDARGGVSGLTTAASLLLAGGIGIAVALYQWLLAFSITVLTLLVLRVLAWIDRRVVGND